MLTLYRSPEAIAKKIASLEDDLRPDPDDGTALADDLGCRQWSEGSLAGLRTPEGERGDQLQRLAQARHLGRVSERDEGRYVALCWLAGEDVDPVVWG